VPDEDAANARLIAAAPDLLAALKELADEICAAGLHNSQFPSRAIENADAAIAKAEGTA